MTTEPTLAGEFDFVCAVDRLYAALIAHAQPGADAEPNLGGQLLYAGELNHSNRALVVAGNVAGAATLAATRDEAARKQAIRDGVVDFAVTTLDEALRILKNEVRKREPVAVCVGAAPDAVELEMLERGVAPDLIADGVGPGFQRLNAMAKKIEPIPAGDSQALLTWSVASSPVLLLPKLDAWVGECVDADAAVERRWLRLSPRFLGRMSRNLRLLRCEPDAAMEFVRRVELAFLRREFGVPVEIGVMRRGISDRRRFAPHLSAPDSKRIR